jgi:hypothetical protein
MTAPIVVNYQLAFCEHLLRRFGPENGNCIWKGLYETLVDTRVTLLKKHLSTSRVDHAARIMHEPTLKDAHVYCVTNGVVAQKYGPFLEKYIISNYGFGKNSASERNGDCSKNSKNYEIKVSLGGSTHSKFNYVQIRLDHDIDWYVMTAYHLTPANVDDMGQLFVFKVPKTEMALIVKEHGGYAHGTNGEEGNREFAIRPKYMDKCWASLCPFLVDYPYDSL